MEATLKNIMLGKRLRECRIQKKKSISEFAELCGISDRYYADLERGVKAPKLDTFVRIANAIGVSSEYLLQDSLTAPDQTNLTAYALERLSPKQKTLVHKFILQFMDTLQ